MLTKKHIYSAMSAAALLLFLLRASPALAQCEPTWLAGPDQGVAGVDGVVRAMTRWDPDGAGPLSDWLVIGGRFTIAGDTAANNIVAWDGERFHPLGGGFDSVAVGRFTQVGDLGSAYWARYGPSLSGLCPADTDCDSAVTPFDLVTYVNLWFADDPSAERTGEIPARIDVFDLLAYLHEWFTGC